MTVRPLLILTAAIAALTSCVDDGPTTSTCPSDLSFSVTPHDTTIAIGEQFTASLAMVGCGGPKRLTDTITFTSSNGAIAVAGKSTGRVIGVSSGTATITASAAYYHVDAPIVVTVR